MKQPTTHLSIRAYAKRRGVSDMAVRKAIAAGRIMTTDGKIDPAIADKQWDTNTNPAQARAASDETAPSSSYHYSRAKKEAYDALLKKLDYEERSGKLIPVEQVEVEAFNAARIARDKLLTIPDRVAPQIIGKKNIQEIKQILRKEIRDSLQDLTDFLHGNKS